MFSKNNLVSFEFLQIFRITQTVMLSLFIVLGISITACDDTPAGSDDNDSAVPGEDFEGLGELYADELHELEYVPAAEPGTAELWIDGERWTFDDQVNCDLEDSRINLSFGKETEEGYTAWVTAERHISEAVDFFMEWDEVHVEVAYGADDDRVNDQGHVRWEQEPGEEVDFWGGDGDLPIIRAKENGEITAKGELAPLLGANPFEGEFELSIRCE